MITGLNRRYVFRAHFNRINMQRGNPNVWTVHTSQGCFQGTKIISHVPMETVYKPTGAQPRAYFKGLAFVQLNPNGSIELF